MNSFIVWLPVWAQAGFLLAGLALSLIFLLMPFAVFGTKPRLEEVELQLGELRAELRSLSMRLSQRSGAAFADEPPTAKAQTPPSPQAERTATRPWSSPEPDRAASPRHPADRASGGDYPAYADNPFPASPPAPPPVSQILRPTHFEPPATRGDPTRQPPRQPRVAPWDVSAEAHPEDRQPPPSRVTPSHDASFRREAEDDAERLRRREEMSPRPPTEDERRRREDERHDGRHPGRARSEPTLRWPPRE